MKMLLIALSLLVPISVSCAAADELAKSERFRFWHIFGLSPMSALSPLCD